MAEVFGLVAAGAQLLDLTFEVISLVRSLSSEIRDDHGSGDWQLSQANTLLALARKIQQDSPPIIEEPLEGCLGELQLVHSKLVEVSAGSRQGRLNRLMMALKFKAHERNIDAAWKRIEDKMKVLSLALQWKSFQAVDGISKRIISDIPASRSTLVRQSAQANGEHLGEASSLTNSNQIYNVQLHKASALVGRARLLETMSSKLGFRKIQTRVALHGLGGIGKSRVAHEYALRITKQLPDTWIFWIQANTKLQFVQDYLGMASCLDLTGSGAVPASVQDVLQYLKHSHFGTWVMIVDSIDDDEILDGERPVVDLIPDTPRGSVIFTTRSKRIAARLTSVDNIIPVGNLEPSEAQDLFCANMGLKVTEIRETDKVSVAELLQSLNYLPLAICHAGSYMSSQQIEISEYLHTFNTSEDAKALLLDDEFPQAPTRVGPVLRTLAISLDHILKINSRAAELLAFMACLTPQSIPRSVLPAANDTNCMTTRSFMRAVGLLRGYHLIVSDNDNQMFDMHAVVHLATRTWLKSRNEFQYWIQKALLSVFNHFPTAPSYESNNLSECARYLPPAEAVLGNKEFPPEYDRPRCLLAYRCSKYLQITGRYGQAAWFSILSAELSAAALGEDDPDHFTKQEHHATILRQNGDFTLAIGIERDILAKRQSIMGAEHRDVFSSLNNLGLSLHSLGQYSEAEKLHRRALKGLRNILGESDSHTLASLNNLSLSLERQEKFSEAERLSRNAVSLKREKYGREHLSTLLSTSNLAICLQSQEKFDEAYKLHAKVLKGRELLLGKHHPQILSAKQGLIASMVDQGQFEGTEEMARGHLALTADVLGCQHNQTIWMAYYLASILLGLGKREEAETHARKAFEAKRRILGIEHSDTKTCEKLLNDVLDQLT